MQEYGIPEIRTENLGSGTVLALARAAILHRDQDPQLVRDLLPARLEAHELFNVLHQVYDGVKAQMRGFAPDYVVEYAGHKTLHWLGKMCAVSGDVVTATNTIKLFDEIEEPRGDRLARSLEKYLERANSLE